MAVAFQFDFQSTLASISYIASRNVQELTKYKICKMLFLADKYHLVTFGRVITGDKYCALPHGPIPSRTLNLLDAVIDGNLSSSEAMELNDCVEIDRRFSYPRFRAQKPVNSDYLSQSDVQALDKVIAEYGPMGFGELKAITHEMYAYQVAWNGKSSHLGAADMQFEAFFEEDSDAVVGAQDLMMEDDALRRGVPANQE